MIYAKRYTARLAAPQPWWFVGAPGRVASQEVRMTSSARPAGMRVLEELLSALAWNG